jgi:Ca2+-transporting ATPase
MDLTAEVVAGHGIARVEATGPQTELGKIGKSVQAAESGETRLEGQVRSLVRVLAAAGLVVCATVATVSQNWES